MRIDSGYAARFYAAFQNFRIVVFDGLNKVLGVVIEVFTVASLVMNIFDFIDFDTVFTLGFGVQRPAAPVKYKRAVVADERNSFSEAIVAAVDARGVFPQHIEAFILVYCL